MIREQTLYDFNTLGPWKFCTLFYVSGYVPVSPSLQSSSYGNLERICILLLCENYINLNYVELVQGDFQVYHILLLFCIFILLIFQSLILKPQLLLLLSCFSCVWLCDPIDGSPPGSSVHGILQARILEWVAMASSRGSSQPRDRNYVSYVSCIDTIYYSYFLSR